MFSTNIFLSTSSVPGTVYLRGCADLEVEVARSQRLTSSGLEKLSSLASGRTVSEV